MKEDGEEEMEEEKLNGGLETENEEGEEKGRRERG